MAVKKWALKALLFKREVSYATDPTPTGTANAIDAQDVTFQPLVSGTASRQPARPYFSGPEEFVTGEHCSIEFAVPMASSGAAGTAPPWGDLARACGMSETITVDTKVEYKPVSEDHDSGTFYFIYDSVQVAILGARGNMTIQAGASGIPELRFSFLGKYAAATDVTMPDLTLTAWPRPDIVSDTNTPTFLLHSFNREMESFELNIGNQLQFRALVNAETIEIVDRNSTGSCKISSKAAATVDWTAIAIAGTQGNLQLIHGTAAGSIVEFLASKVQIMNPRLSNSNGFTMDELDLALKPTAGDDDFTLTAR